MFQHLASREESPTAERPRLWNARYGALDGWRGLAALAVVVQHVFHVRIGHTAVMLFFVISGYCITASATSCLKRGLGFREFMWRRIRRIYPPYLLAVGYFIATRLIKAGLGGVNQLDLPLHVWIQNFTMTQWLSLLNANYAYAADNPANFVTAYWSLNYEEQFYLVIALMMVASLHLRRSLQFFALPLIGVALLWNVLRPYYSHGIFIEYWLHFGVGLLLFYRLCRMKQRFARRFFDASLVVLALCSAYVAWFVQPDWYYKRPLGMELFTVAVFGLLLVLLRPLDERFGSLFVGRLLKGLGAISYSLYLIHQCNIRLVEAVAARLLPANWEWPSMLLQLALHVLLAVPFYFICERPFLNKSLVGDPASTDKTPAPTSFPEVARLPVSEATP